MMKATEHPKYEKIHIYRKRATINKLKAKTKLERTKFLHQEKEYEHFLCGFEAGWKACSQEKTR